jgi:hypothetical protein
MDFPGVELTDRLQVSFETASTKGFEKKEVVINLIN